MSNTSWTLYAHEVTLKRDQFMKTIAWLEAVRKDWKFIYNILFTYWTYAILSSFKVLTKTGMRSSFKVSKRILRLRRQVCMNASLLFVLLFFVKGATSSFSHKLLWNAFIEISNRNTRYEMSIKLQQYHKCWNANRTSRATDPAQYSR